MAREPLEVPPPSPGAWPIWGHDHAVRELMAATVRGPRHAYILSGYDMVGKRALADVFAQAMVCPQVNASGTPCGTCSACRRVTRGSHPDVSLYDLARQLTFSDAARTGKNLSLTIATVRDITANISLRPMEAERRVVIVDDVESMQETAQEAFLKTLEEPPAYATILLLTTDAELLLDTIRSRAMTIQLQTVPSELIERMLTSAGVNGTRAEAIAAASLGRPGWAIRAANDDALLDDRLALRSSTLEWLAGDPYRRVVEATRLGDAFGKDRADVYRQLSMAQALWRSALLHSIDAGGDDDDTRVLAHDPAANARAVRSVEQCMNELDANVRPRLALQAMVLQWPTT